jgi:hypothetical protein
MRDMTTRTRLVTAAVLVTCLAGCGSAAKPARVTHTAAPAATQSTPAASPSGATTIYHGDGFQLTYPAALGTASTTTTQAVKSMEVTPKDDPADLVETQVYAQLGTTLEAALQNFVTKIGAETTIGVMRKPSFLHHPVSVAGAKAAEQITGTYTSRSGALVHLDYLIVITPSGGEIDLQAADSGSVSFDLAAVIASFKLTG